MSWEAIDGKQVPGAAPLMITIHHESITLNLPRLMIDLHILRVIYHMIATEFYQHYIILSAVCFD